MYLGAASYYEPVQLSYKQKLVRLNTATIQMLLVSMYPSLRQHGITERALTDGRWGPKTALYWKGFAELYEVNPYIAKASPDGKQVLVDQNTYWLGKAVAKESLREEKEKSYNSYNLSGWSDASASNKFFTVVAGIGLVAAIANVFLLWGNKD